MICATATALRRLCCPNCRRSSALAIPVCWRSRVTVDSLAADIRNQLRRLVANSDATLKDAIENRTTLTARMTALTRKASMSTWPASSSCRTRLQRPRGAMMPICKTQIRLRPKSRCRSSLSLPPSPPRRRSTTILRGRQTAGFLIALGAALCLVFLRKWMGGALLPEDQTAGRMVVHEPAFNHDAEPAPPPRPMPDLPQPLLRCHHSRCQCRPVVTGELDAVQRELAQLRAKWRLMLRAGRRCATDLAADFSLQLPLSDTIGVGRQISRAEGL